MLATDPIDQALFQRSRRQARWRRLLGKVRHTCNDLLPAGEILAALDLSQHRDLGRQQVPLASIVGSSGRATDFDLAFRPLQEHNAARWQSVAAGRRAGRNLPPVSLLKIGDAYLVEDGNHRVSVARARGDLEISAHVIELDPAPMRPAHECTRLGYKVGR